MRRLLAFLLPLFLLLPPLSADEDLRGTWEGAFVDDRVGEITTRLIFDDDGSFEIDQVIEVKDDFLAGADLAEAPAIEQITASGSGTYGVEGDRLSVEIIDLDLRIDGEDLAGFFTRVARALARQAADAHGVPDANYPAFEEAYVEEFFVVLDEVEFLAVFGEEGGTRTWSIDNHLLTLMAEAGGGAWEFDRLDGAMTAVARTAWGAVKAHGVMRLLLR